MTWSPRSIRCSIAGASQPAPDGAPTLQVERHRPTPGLRLAYAGYPPAAFHQPSPVPGRAYRCGFIAWLQLLALDEDLAIAEPKRLRYRIRHTAARLTDGRRRR
jgi:hypothetical protein